MERFVTKKNVIRVKGKGRGLAVLNEIKIKSYIWNYESITTIEFNISSDISCLKHPMSNWHALVKAVQFPNAWKVNIMYI